MVGNAISKRHRDVHQATSKEPIDSEVGAPGTIYAKLPRECGIAADYSLVIAIMCTADGHFCATRCTRVLEMWNDAIQSRSTMLLSMLGRSTEWTFPCASDTRTSDAIGSYSEEAIL